MPYDEYTKSVLSDARETLRRVDAMKGVAFTEPIEDNLTKWRREGRESQARRDAESERTGLITRLCEQTARYRSELADAMGAVSTLAATIAERLEEASDQIEKLKRKLEVADARITDLVTRSSRDDNDAKAIIDLPNPLYQRQRHAS
jgi:chromosome segregation ATPase